MMNPLFSLADRLLASSRQMKAEQFAELAPKKGDIIFLGDSITEGGLWSEWLPSLPVRNRGIDGDTTSGVLPRTRVAMGQEPAAVVLLIGTNDLSLGVPIAGIAANVRSIVRAVRDQSPSTHVIIQSVMPRTPRRRRSLGSLNALLQAVANDEGAEWLDLWPALQTPDGTLQPSMTADHLHLNGQGYRAWLTLLQPRLEQLAQSRA